VQVGPRPLNPQWINPHDQEEKLVTLQNIERRRREAARQLELASIADLSERRIREKEHEEARAREVVEDRHAFDKAALQLQKERMEVANSDLDAGQQLRAKGYLTTIEQRRRQMVALLFVDIDGVLSLWGWGMDGWPNDGAWHQIDGVTHFLSARAARNLLALCTMFDPVWCSGWEEKADEYLPHMLGLPRFPHLSFQRNPGRGLAHWKLDAIESYAENRSLAWVDDALNEACFEWAQRRSAPTLLVATRPATGLDDAAAAELERWALSPASRARACTGSRCRRAPTTAAGRASRS